MRNNRLQKRLPAFTLVELLVSLMILGGATGSVVAIYANVVQYATYDTRLQKAIDKTGIYFSKAYATNDLSAAFLSDAERNQVENANTFPFVLQMQTIDVDNYIKMKVYKEVKRAEPMLIKIRLEMEILPDAANQTVRRYTAESEFSEAYLSRLE